MAVSSEACVEFSLQKGICGRLCMVSLATAHAFFCAFWISFALNHFLLFSFPFIQRDLVFTFQRGPIFSLLLAVTSLFAGRGAMDRRFFPPQKC